jgi:hypothetical protein
VEKQVFQILMTKFEVNILDMKSNKLITQFLDIFLFFIDLDDVPFVQNGWFWEEVHLSQKCPDDEHNVPLCAEVKMHSSNMCFYLDLFGFSFCTDMLLSM